MSSVTQRIGEIKQPKGGYIKPSQFESKILNDNETLHETENIHASVVGMAVDYLTRLVMGTSVNDAFRISLWGAEYATCWIPNAIDIGYNLAENIKGIDDQSIINACKLVTFDMWYRDSGEALKFWLNNNNDDDDVQESYDIMRNTLKKILGNIGNKNMNYLSNIDANEVYQLRESLNHISEASKSFYNSNDIDSKDPDIYTIKNIQTMVRRSVNFWKEYGPIVKNGFEFKKKAYTKKVDAGDGDFLTSDTIWDFKVSKNKPNNKNTLQLLMYWIMGQHSGEKEFKNITNLGIFNPRLNTVYTLPTSNIERETIKTVEKWVIGY